jgi:hypothetical protein
MSIRKQLRGVLEVVTSSGVHYLVPSFSERVYLTWMFRNFRTLPLSVLTDPQRRRIEHIANRNHKATSFECDEVLGTIDCMPVMKRKPVQSAPAARLQHTAQV